MKVAAMKTAMFTLNEVAALWQVMYGHPHERHYPYGVYMQRAKADEVANYLRGQGYNAFVQLVYWN
jgi:hypothetical protein